jgi:polyhydroxyalkanoate synthase
MAPKAECDDVPHLYRRKTFMTDKKPDITANPTGPMDLFEGSMSALHADHSVQAEMMQDYAKFVLAIAKQPNAPIQMQTGYWTDQINLLENFSLKTQGQPAKQVAAPAHDDKRFKDTEWTDNPAFDMIKQSYLSAVSHARGMLGELDGLDDETRRRIEFNLRQMSDALSPTNFPLMNPEVIRATISSKGANLVKGAQHLVDDFLRGGGRLSPELTDRSAFDVGRNLAMTPGKVVYQNDVIQLIQYAPSTETVRQRPVLIVPSWINKFYILDLSEKNSFVRWLVNEGYAVFIISWVNPDKRHADKTFGDYMTMGPLAAIDKIAALTGETSVNTVGYCIGGTLLATTLAVMASRNDTRIASVTYLTTLVDFADPGDMAVFTSDAHLEELEHETAKNGYLDASVMAETFSMLRANDLVWSVAIKSYFLGQEPAPFDLLFWNADSTRMPGGLHMSYLRDMYRDNRLVQAGSIVVDGVPVDLGKIRTPTYILSTREDHIAPWRSTYAATQIYGGDTTFVLAGSGHVGGVVNPVTSKKYGYWTNSALRNTSEEWLAEAQHTPGSWWVHWNNWLGNHAGDLVPARQPGEHGPVIEDAPGSYVRRAS